MTQSQPLKVEPIKVGMVTPPREANVPAATPPVTTAVLTRWRNELDQVVRGERNSPCLSGHAAKTFIRLIDELLQVRAAQEAQALQAHLEQKHEPAA